MRSYLYALSFLHRKADFARAYNPLSHAFLSGLINPIFHYNSIEQVRYRIPYARMPYATLKCSGMFALSRSRFEFQARAFMETAI